LIRFLDIIFSFFGLLIICPLIILISILIKLSSPGTIFFIQKRVGLKNKDIHVYKFRTMYVGSEKSGFLTVGSSDIRITPIGGFLRKFKLDELPQLFNVLIGNMSFVGPRPEVRKYVDFYTENQKKILLLKPGITDWASLKFINENDLLKESQDPELYYKKSILPEKIQLGMRYNNSVSEYFKIIFLTIFKVFKN